MQIKSKPTKPEGKLGILTPGMGAVSTTFMAGVEAIRKGQAQPIGSLTQMGTIRLGKRTENRTPMIKDFVPLAELEDIVFGGWDIFEDNAYQAAAKAGVLQKDTIDAIRPFLESIKPMKAVFDQNYVKKLHGTYVKEGKTKMDLAEQLMDDIAAVKKQSGASRAVMIWCASTETFLSSDPVHKDIGAFERGLMTANEERHLAGEAHGLPREVLFLDVGEVLLIGGREAPSHQHDGHHRHQDEGYRNWVG